MLQNLINCFKQSYFEGFRTRNCYQWIGREKSYLTQYFLCQTEVWSPSYVRGKIISISTLWEKTARFLDGSNLSLPTSTRMEICCASSWTASSTRPSNNLPSVNFPLDLMSNKHTKKSGCAYVLKDSYAPAWTWRRHAATRDFEKPRFQTSWNLPKS